MNHEKLLRSGTASVIGAGVQFQGDIRFKGALQVLGEIDGDVVCQDDSNGVLIVEESGRINGSVKVPNVVLMGRITGPVLSSKTIEVHPKARILGDTCYNTIDIHVGGIIDGALLPVALIGQNIDPADKTRGLESAASGRKPAKRFDSGQRLALTLTVIIAVLTIAWVNREPSPPIPANEPFRATDAAPQKALNTVTVAAPPLPVPIGKNEKTTPLAAIPAKPPVKASVPATATTPAATAVVATATTAPVVKASAPASSPATPRPVIAPIKAPIAKTPGAPSDPIVIANPQPATASQTGF